MRVARNGATAHASDPTHRYNSSHTLLVSHQPQTLLHVPGQIGPISRAPPFPPRSHGVACIGSQQRSPSTTYTAWSGL
jgi:hypothetical protein